jgi:hypothetical protein
VPELHLVGLAAAIDLQLQPLGQGVDHRDPDPVQAAGEAVILGCVEGILIDNDNNNIYGASDSRGNGAAEGY